MPLTGPNDKAPPCPISLRYEAQEYGLGKAQVAIRPLVSNTLLTQGGQDPSIAQIQQREWAGGRGQDDFSDDETKFYDSMNLWTTTEGLMHNSLLTQFATGLRNAEEYMPDENNSIYWQSLLSSTLYASVSFDPSSTYTADKIYFYIKRKGSPGTLTFELQGDSGGDPDGSALQTVTVDTVDVDDIITVFQVFDWTGTQSMSSGTTYHMVIYGDSNDDVASHWLIGVDEGTSSGRQSNDGATWVSTSYKLYYRCVDADVGLKYHPFRLETAWYVATEPDDDSAGSVYLLGDRGMATSGGNTTLTDTDQSWATDEWADGYVRIHKGTGRGQVREITSNTSTALTVSTWDINPSTDSEYVIYKTGIINEVSTPGLSKPVTSVVVVNNVAYMAQGDGTNIRRMRWNESTPGHDFADDGTNQADMITPFMDNGKRYIYIATNSTALVERAIEQDWGIDLRFTDSGTAEGGGSNFLKDTNKSWEEDEWVGARLVLDGGTGDGQSYDVLSNTVDTLTISGTWATNPDGTTTYDVHKKATVGSNDYDFTGFATYDSTLVAFKEDGEYSDVHADPLKVDVDLGSLTMDTNGAAVTLNDFFLLFSWAYSIEQQFGKGVNENAQLTDIGPWRGTGLPSDRRGIVSSLDSVMNYVFAAVDGEDDNISSLLVWNQAGYGEIYRAYEAGQRIRTSFWQTCPGTNPRLWIQVGNDLVYMDFPYQSMNPLQDSTCRFAHESVFVSSYVTMGVTALEKYYRSLVLNTENLGTAVRIGMDYQYDDDVGLTGYDNWTIVGEYTGSPQDELRIGEGDKRRLRYRLRLKTSSNEETPVIHETSLNGFARLPDTDVVIATFNIEDVHIDKDGYQETDPDEFYEWLMLRKEAADGVRLYADKRYRYLHDKDYVIAGVRPDIEDEFPGEKSWRGKIQVVLQKV